MLTRRTAARTISAGEAAGLVRSGDWLGYGAVLAQPDAFDQALAARLPCAAPTEVDRAVARLIAGEVDNGASLQIGIGAMPNAVCSLLLESGVRDLGIHTEMLTDGIIDL